MSDNESLSIKNAFSAQVDERTNALGARVSKAAAELRSVGDQLRSAPVVAPIAPFTDRGIAAVEAVGTYLETGDTQQFINDFQALARRRPWTVAGGAVVAGFVAARFLKTTPARARVGGASA